MLLRAQYIRDTVALSRMLLDPRDPFAPGRRLGRIAREELPQARIIVDVVGREPGNPPKPPDIDGKSTVGSRDARLGEHRGYCRKPPSAVSRKRRL
jgi:hypothetical protein